MIANQFTWADLSTYDLNIAKRFYSSVFDWQYTDFEDDYFLASYHYQLKSGLYETPEKYQAMNMPSFWMSYIYVENTLSIVEQALQCGGKVELIENYPNGTLALIRDPSGAGFSIYNGLEIKMPRSNSLNAPILHELFVSNLQKVKNFYYQLFRWRFEKVTTHQYHIIDETETHIASAQELSNTIKGNFQYWAIHFSIKDRLKARKKVIDFGGNILYEDKNDLWVNDPSGAFFNLREID